MRCWTTLKPRRSVQRALAALMAVIAAGGCVLRPHVAGDRHWSFSRIQREIFEAPTPTLQGACTSCHKGDGADPDSRGLSLLHDSAYDALVNRASTERSDRLLVAPGDPAHSYLVDKLEGGSGMHGNRMPRNGPPYLTERQIRGIKEWIARGAPRD
jgi:hypothetical protein